MAEASMKLPEVERAAFQVLCYDAAGFMVVVASEVNGSLVVHGDMSRWQEIAAALHDLTAADAQRWHGERVPFLAPE